MVTYNNSLNNLSRNQSVRSVTGSTATLAATDNVIEVNSGTDVAYSGGVTSNFPTAVYNTSAIVSLTGGQTVNVAATGSSSVVNGGQGFCFFEGYQLTAG